MILQGLGPLTDSNSRPSGLEPSTLFTMEAGMLSLLEKTGLRIVMGEPSRRRILEEFTKSPMVDRTVDVYRIATSGQR